MLMQEPSVEISVLACQGIGVRATTQQPRVSRNSVRMRSQLETSWHRRQDPVHPFAAGVTSHFTAPHATFGSLGG